eukprot:TRINITY_DN2081_c0_g1_i2.p1 TRINITY_DN2081_c0_g1~~TRINITY_DN2081_c0_g1_i2.p1  ORF type:complete len:408 (-),score=116.32 TRINITY_DN2081_c0_g1_i2:24-1247(-)
MLASGVTLPFLLAGLADGDVLREAGVLTAVARSIILKAAETEAAVGKKPAAAEVHPRCVTADVARLQLEQIDCPGQEFALEMALCLSWEQTTPMLPEGMAAVLKEHGGTAMLTPGQLWHPLLAFPNALEIEVTHEAVALLQNSDDSVRVVHATAVRGRFRELFELNRFPFDRQLLRVRVCNDVFSNPDDKPIMFEAPKRNENGKWNLDLKQFAQNDQVEWLTDFGATPNPVLGFYDEDRVLETPGFIVEIKVQRKAGFYFWNTIVPLALIVSLSFLSAVFPTGDAASRLALTVTLLLTAVAFKGTTTSYLPKISYLTMLDVFIVAAFSTLSLVVCENSLLSVISDKHVAHACDVACLAALGVLWLLTLASLFVAKVASAHQSWTAIREIQHDQEKPRFTDSAGTVQL